MVFQINHNSLTQSKSLYDQPHHICPASLWAFLPLLSSHQLLMSFFSLDTKLLFTSRLLFILLPRIVFFALHSTPPILDHLLLLSQGPLIYQLFSLDSVSTLIKNYLNNIYLFFDNASSIKQGLCWSCTILYIQSHK